MADLEHAENMYDDIKQYVISRTLGLWRMLFLFPSFFSSPSSRKVSEYEAEVSSHSTALRQKEQSEAMVSIH